MKLTILAAIFSKVNIRGEMQIFQEGVTIWEKNNDGSSGDRGN